MNTSPKVTASSATALVVALIMTFLMRSAPVLSGHSDIVAAVITALVTGGAAWLAGWLKKAVVWAEQYVAEHQAGRILGRHGNR